jgi:hypothetical protein
MLESYVTGLAAMVVLMIAWLGIQFAWRKVFPCRGSDPDALAGRLGCRGCAGAGACEQERRDRVESG